LDEKALEESLANTVADGHIAIVNRDLAECFKAMKIG